MGVIDPAAASSISVTVRVRPFTIREAAQLVKNDDSNLFLGDGSLAAAPTPKLKQHGLRSVIKVVDDRCLVFDPPEDNPVQKFSRSVVPTGKKVKDQVFAFDRIFDDNASQTDIYEATTKPLLDSVLDGYNATVFAYGATGCGKTHTITGTAQHPGIIFLTMQELFEKISERSDEKVTELSLSYLEIYNETIRDLLVPGGSKAGLMLREDSHQAVTVAGLTSHHPKDVQEVMDMIVQGNEYRTVSPTEANATSSRSHAVLQINIAQKDRNADVNEPHTMATLSIIDLAGSERASATKNRGERLMEGANINKSLLALGSCINALCDPRKKNHVPYRNSKLTRLLKFSLGGNCKTVMIVCVSPSSAHFDETQNTLRYANRAKNIQTKVTRNVFNVNRHVKDFLVKIDEQIALINELKAQQKDAENTFFAKFRKQLEKREGVAREGVLRIRAAYEHSASERQEKITNMKKLRMFERRIGLLSAWIAAFDTVCDSRGDEDTMPPNLVTIRKTAQGILAELENSRQHLHRKLDKSNWERAVDSALTHSISQLSSGDCVVDNGEVANLTREAELLKSNFMREAYREVMDHDRSGDAGMVQVLLNAQFEILASLSETLTMDEEEVVAHAKTIINRLLQTGYSAVSHVVKPDGSMAPVEMFPPTKRGTPKRKKTPNINVKPIPMVAPPAFAALSAAQQQVLAASAASASPMKSSPRRRKALNTRKGVSFTPKKKSPGSRRMVRWRDDESEHGTLADYEKTPQKFDSTPEQASPEKASLSAAAGAPLAAAAASLPLQPLPTYLNNSNTAGSATANDSGSESSPSLIVPEATSLAAKPNRFQAGFLSKGRTSSVNVTGSPLSGPSLSFNNSVSSPDSSMIAAPPKRSSPLRAIDVAKASNTLSPSSSSSTFGLRKSSLSPRAPTLTSLDENTPLSASLQSHHSSRSVSIGGSGSESESPSALVDPHKLRAAIHSAKRRDRLSLMSATTASSAKRISSVGSNSSVHSNGGGSGHHRASASYSGPAAAALASSANGISRQRRRSGGASGGGGGSGSGSAAERRRSPPIACSPPGSDSGSGSGRDNSTLSFSSGAGRGTAGGLGLGRSFTPGQARRMNLGGSMRGGGGGGGGAHDGGGNGSGGLGLTSPRDARAEAKARRITIGSSGASAGFSGGNSGSSNANGGAPVLGGSVRKEVSHRPSVVWR